MNIGNFNPEIFRWRIGTKCFNFFTIKDKDFYFKSKDNILLIISKLVKLEDKTFILGYIMIVDTSNTDKIGYILHEKIFLFQHQSNIPVGSIYNTPKTILNTEVSSLYNTKLTITPKMNEEGWIEMEGFKGWFLNKKPGNKIQNIIEQRWREIPKNFEDWFSFIGNEKTEK